MHPAQIAAIRAELWERIWSDFESFFDHGHYYLRGDKKEVSIKYEPPGNDSADTHRVGWRDALRAYDTAITSIIGQYEVMEKEDDYEAFMYKFGEEYGIHRYEKDLWYFNVNDVFAPAADSEDIRPEDFPEIKKIVKYWGYNGLLYWVWKRRNRPKCFRKHTQKLMERMEFLQIQDEGLI